MGEVKIDLKDRKILDVLAVDGRASLALLARKVGVSKQVAIIPGTENRSSS